MYQEKSKTLTGLLSPKSYMYMPAKPEKSDFLYTIFFFAKLPTHQYTIFDRKAPNLPKLGAFYNNLLKTHPIF